MGWMQTTCREAARLMSARQDEALGPWREFALKLHLRLCGDCREIERQFDQMRRLTGECLHGGDEREPPPRQPCAAARRPMAVARDQSLTLA